jgi:hypothetical protein
MLKKDTSTIQVDLSTKVKLDDLKIGNESYDTVILRLLDVYEYSMTMYKNEIGTKIIEGFK